MCGICGAYNIIDKDLLKSMCNAIEHRGPDDEGHYIGADVMLGMRRLKIIDLYTGNQPIYNEDGTIVIVYNGEIYNFLEIRKFLEQNGHTFKTNTDTEVIVHLYEELGDRAVERLRGMFAFALWDSSKKRLLLARDRIGIKPLYYYCNDGTVIFASELKAILRYEKIKKRINFNALHDYLTFMYVPAPDTIFRDIYKLEQGHILVCENGNIEIKKYWDVNACFHHDDLEDLFKDEASIGEKMYELVKESLRLHLISDVPVGVFLSGGLDSGTIVAALSEISNNPINTFSVGFPDERDSEIALAGVVAKRFNTVHHEYIVNPASMGDLQKILYFFDEPFADSSAIPTYYVSRYARESVAVALSGDGGDEIFGGYGNYKADKIGLFLRKFPAVVRNKLTRFIVKAIPALDTAKVGKILDALRTTPERAHILWLNCFSEDSKRELYVENHLMRLLDRNSMDRYSSFFNEFDMNDFINKCICVDIKTVLPNDYLTKIDRMSMANSLEVRVPFLDHKLLEFAVRMSSKYKLRGLTTKYLLRKIMKDKLPKEIITGRKKGFTLPLASWFREDFSALVNEFLSKDIIQKRGYFNFTFIKNLADVHLAGKGDNSKLLWALICFEIWHRKFIG